MARYVVSRLLQMIPTLLGVILVVFAVSHLIPNDPVLVMLSSDYTPEQYTQMRAYLGLDKPLHVQFWLYLKRLLRGDLGRSIVTDRPVFQAILERLPATFTLGIAGFILSLLISIPIGILSAVKPYSRADDFSMLGALLGVSVPTFWEGVMLILLFSYYLDWLPVAGRGMPPDIQHLILPAVTLGTHATATNIRLIRSCMLEVLGEEYVMTARAKGVREALVINKHALRNAMIPVVTNVGMQLTWMMSGLTIIEVVFGWPGVGKLAFDAVVHNDFPLVQGAVLLVALLFIGINLLVDLLYSVLDPRIRYG